ncbi:L-2-hydroxyglutarate oxidase LhgO [Azospirillum lipoferum]|uniref:NAD(P)/FAD-dependent oxidoreductase n=1 Tax=Azospirillum lipoferum TaxID=193 RepID=A0A5A9GUM4_AZOLI|nr:MULTISPECIES: NAD(P)/FAD-dependent oxidoreductase [Azospirillum]KAA0598100.1 NAD(P)/FAD-dependent oxidoreductase [Azospirillum lipoferum]MCP1613780.1 L-2-hydroxyglutarate oxidase LhgO [Azospirillum lipoferum]MDW5534768.1 NAD(P)/FAD-dependent oxidoreductase [Azospirillum sp. NL1]
MERVECVVVGAGVVGLAVARRLAQAGREVIVLEAADAIGTGTSSRNSEVIHAGIYYPTGSLRARLCVPGRDALYDYCAAHGVEHRRIGKLIVATEEAQLPKLAAIRAQAAANGVTDLTEIDAATAQAWEPNLRTVGALLSPSTGIIDSHGLMLALLGDAEEAGTMLALLSPLLRSHRTAGGFELEVGGAEPMRIACTTLVNAAGLGAWAVARGLEGLDATHVPPRVLAKGNYYALAAGRSPFSRLVYPVPVEGGLGVHLTLDLAGQARFGPDVEWLGDLKGAVDYAVDPARADSFYGAVRAYWPGLPDGALVPAYSGVRPKLSGPGQPQADFLIQGPGIHGVDGLVNLFGIESPGLTSCLAIADAVAVELGETPEIFA